MIKLAALSLVGVLVSGPWAPPLAQYRDVTLGDSVQTVAERLQVSASDVKVLYAAPSLVQEITWRPHRFVSGTTVVADPLAEMVLTFHSNRLTRIIVSYDRERTQGLTDADLHELLTTEYGTALLRSTPTTPTVARIGINAQRQTISSWADAETLLLLWREEYPRRVGLTIAATNADRALQEAIVEGARLEVEGAPRRAIDKQVAAAAATEQRDAKIRKDNKAKFKP